MLPRLVALAAGLASSLVFAHDGAPASSTTPPYTVTPVIQQAMSDSGLAGYDMLAVRLDIIPGGTDATPHRHDADLFIYVLEGSIEVELAGQKSTYVAGSMFHEPRNVVHSLLRNTSSEAPARALAMFVIKKGREFLVPVAK